jgi:hypothetical protein
VLRPVFGTGQIGLKYCGMMLPASSACGDLTPVLRSYASFTQAAAQESWSGSTWLYCHQNGQKGRKDMGQQYMQKFEYRSASKSDFDQAWTVALQTFAQAGNWGGAETGVRHIKTYGTAWRRVCLDRR